MNASLTIKIHDLYDQGLEASDIGDMLGIHPDTIATEIRWYLQSELED